MQEAYIADSESSSIRAVNLKTGGSRLIAGGDPYLSENLFRVLIDVTLLFRLLIDVTLFFLIFFLSFWQVKLINLWYLENIHYSLCFSPTALRYSQLFNH